MPQLKVPPTKTNLLRAKESLRLAKEGYDLLNEKREVLLMELMGIVHDLKRTREEAEHKLREAYSALETALVTMGEEDTHRVISTSQRQIELQVVERSIMGVAIPTVTFNASDRAQEILLGETTSAFDQTREKFEELLPILVRWAQIEISVFRLATEIKKMQRRVKALENTFIPDYENTILTIEKILEEVEREEFFRKKMVKRRLERKCLRR